MRKLSLVLSTCLIANSAFSNETNELAPCYKAEYTSRYQLSEKNRSRMEDQDRDRRLMDSFATGALLIGSSLLLVDFLNFPNREKLAETYNTFKRNSKRPLSSEVHIACMLVLVGGYWHLSELIPEGYRTLKAYFWSEKPSSEVSDPQ
jgi:hypothetical protein